MAECVHPTRWKGMCTVCGDVEGDNPLKKQVVTPMPEAYTQFRSHTIGRATQERSVQLVCVVRGDTTMIRTIIGMDFVVVATSMSVMCDAYRVIDTGKLCEIIRSILKLQQNLVQNTVRFKQLKECARLFQVKRNFQICIV